MPTSVTIVVTALTLYLQVSQNDAEVVWINNKAFGRSGPSDGGFKTSWEFVKFYTPSSSSLVVLVGGRIRRPGDVARVFHFVDAASALVLAPSSGWEYQAVVGVVRRKRGVVGV